MRLGACGVIEPAWRLPVVAGVCVCVCARTRGRDWQAWPVKSTGHALRLRGVLPGRTFRELWLTAADCAEILLKRVWLVSWKYG